VIRIRNLTKTYGTRVAVDDISFSVQKGEIVGFLGPNGAGKTTTMRMITGCLMPTRGEISVADIDMRTHSLDGRRHIGYMPEVVPLYTDMSTRAYLEYVARLRGLDKQKARRRADEVVDLCHLDDYVDTIMAKLSRGFRQRVGLAQAVIHEPDVLVLDEPTVGVDPIQVAQTRELIRVLGRERTILLSTHILPEVSMICERVIIIHRGRIVAQDRIEALSALSRGRSGIRLKVDGPPEEVSIELKHVGAIQDVSYEAPYHLASFESDKSPHAEITSAIVRRGWTLLLMAPVEMSLEDIFLDLTSEEEAKR
jgi:ABC-2 type transport system ATP-binding protein